MQVGASFGIHDLQATLHETCKTGATFGALDLAKKIAHKENWEICKFSFSSLYSHMITDSYMLQYISERGGK